MTVSVADLISDSYAGQLAARIDPARRIVDAICADDGPIRYGCDDLSEGMLAGWRSAESDEVWMRSLLPSFTEL